MCVGVTLEGLHLKSRKRQCYHHFYIIMLKNKEPIKINQNLNNWYEYWNEKVSYLMIHLKLPRKWIKISGNRQLIQNITEMPLKVLEKRTKYLVTNLLKYPSLI